MIPYLRYPNVPWVDDEDYERDVEALFAEPQDEERDDDQDRDD